MGEVGSNNLERSARNDPAAMARKLAREHSAMQAFRLAARSIAAARRARSRKRYQFWTAVAAELEARFARADRLGDDAAPGRIGQRDSEAHPG